MLCLDCGKRQKSAEPGTCASCGARHNTVPGVHGINHVSQLLHAIEQCREGRLDRDGLQDRFAAFEEGWQGFVERWRLEEGTIAEGLGLNGTLLTVYGPLLERLEEALGSLNSALDMLDAMETAGPHELEKLEEEVRDFWRGSCSALAGLFKKLDTRHGDVDSLLSSLFAG
jgi:hypothetical protein